MSNASRNVELLRLRNRLNVYEAAYIVVDKLGGTQGDAVELLVEAISSGDLPAQIVRVRNSRPERI